MQWRLSVFIAAVHKARLLLATLANHITVILGNCLPEQVFLCLCESFPLEKVFRRLSEIVLNQGDQSDKLAAFDLLWVEVISLTHEQVRNACFG